MLFRSSVRSVSENGLTKSRGHFVSIADFGLAGALGDNDTVNHPFQPAGRLRASNSQYAFRFMSACTVPAGIVKPTSGPTPMTPE